MSFERNCGATTGENVEISVLPANAALPNNPGNIFVGDYNHGAASYVAHAEWLSNDSILITYSPHARVFSKQERAGPITITFVQDQ